MLFRKNPQQEAGTGKPDSSGAKPGSETAPAAGVRDVAAPEKPLRRNFPGPRGAPSPLRVALDKSAHAELIAHAKASLNAEICGVLAGRVCEDDEGLFVHVQAVIRGTGASEASTRVTFTQATWTEIHRTLERDYPKLKIVGWYHSHPGFGVEFSEMDLFIQRNFFASPTQIALVTDPVNGAVAICMNSDGGVQYLPRFWVDGREQECKVPVPARDAGKFPVVLTEESGTKLRELESRLGQLTLAVDDLHNSLHRFLLLAAMFFCVAVLGVAGYGIYLQFKARVEPPKDIGFMPIPVKIGDHTAMLGVSVKSWQVPPELDAVVQKAADQLKAELEKQILEAGGTDTVPAMTNLPAMEPETKP